MMEAFLIYVATFFIVFILLPTIYLILRILFWLISIKCGFGKPQTNSAQQQQRQQQRAAEQERISRQRQLIVRRHFDRQGNIFTISDEARGPQNYPDFFVLEPNSQVRSPLDKDDKDLPTYEEVMALSNLTAPTAAAAGSITPTSMPTSTNLSNHRTETAIAINNDNISDLPMEVPPYTETDPNPIATTSGNTFTVAIPANNSSNIPATPTTLPLTEPSTSRNVAAPLAASTVVVTTAAVPPSNV